jgi:hemolysin-activating ACP:hemolysin acyltransferase
MSAKLKAKKSASRTSKGGKSQRKSVKASNQQLEKLISRSANDPFAIARAQSASFGAVAYVLSSSAEYKDMTLERIKRIISPAIRNHQLLVGHETSGALPVPVAAVLWAKVTDELDRVLMQNCNALEYLSPKAWESGNKVWVMVSAGRQRAVERLLQILIERYVGQSIRMRVRSRNGYIAVTLRDPDDKNTEKRKLDS